MVIYNDLFIQYIQYVFIEYMFIFISHHITVCDSHILENKFPILLLVFLTFGAENPVENEPLLTKGKVGSVGWHQIFHGREF